MITRGYSGSRAHAQSKLSQIMFTIDLAEEAGLALRRGVLRSRAADAQVWLAGCLDRDRRPLDLSVPAPNGLTFTRL
jgi:transposase